MGRGAVGPPSRYSRRVVANVDRLRRDKGLTVGELLSRAGMTKSYYQSRAGFSLPYNTNDIEALAAALGVTPEEVASPETTARSEMRVAAAPLAARVRRLVQSQAAAEDDLLEHLADVDPLLADNARALLDAVSHTVVLDEEVLPLIAHWADVPTEYLTDYTDATVTDRTDAQLELRDAMRAAGASSIRFRALGEMSPDALRAIAHSLRSGPDDT
ncbi:helix-turn-helix transcriptional regulator [Microbacterium sp. SORGH_AS_0344]|uniref:helix-turn-helix transcriptional regulator n=1 Tax=Microbacterium sp. SORGH_AS_0344 TaxID=3041767 RepID=UPI0027885233|nr:helix-turn-helix transcriptional regulator [Microbacterium sp. SORGH_AS_0344]MDQ1085177.1 transcriptional regulator with XRE-family HTH domain [Microbacterium sp. SORGH_AS_0344]MDQ1169517.1 transcriptional regulator with XRE-family HTH domain [Microbacterium proteolyticum]